MGTPGKDRTHPFLSPFSLFQSSKFPHVVRSARSLIDFGLRHPGPPSFRRPPALENLATTNAYAVDFSTYAPVSTFSCLKSAGYSAVFIRGYNPVGDGSYDTNAAANVKNAYSAGIGTEIYMTPVPMSSKSAATEMDEMINGLQNAGITIRSIWIQVKSRNSWYSHSSTNINFLSALISRAQQRGLTVGIYTSTSDWKSITDNWTGAGSNVMLWYWNVFGTGVGGESPANFSDFLAFGSFQTPTVKQFGQNETVCSITVNRDVYLSSAKASKLALVEGPVVGFIGL